MLPERPNIDVALGEAREVSYAALDVDDGLGVARREGGAAGGARERPSANSLPRRRDILSYKALVIQLAAKPSKNLLNVVNA